MARPLRKAYVYIILLLVSVQSVIVLQRCSDTPGSRHTPRLKKEPGVAELLTDDDFAGTESCIECHLEAYEDWVGSHHDEAMMKAGEKSVKGDFRDISYTSQGVTTRFYRDGEKFMVNTEGPDGAYQDYEIVYTFGIEPLQQYIVEFPKGRYQCLRIAWDTEEGKWFDLYPDMKLALQEWLHWTNGSMTWNTTCADCHSTNVHKNYFNEADSFNTTYTIIDVSCEACHGPSKKHIQYINSDLYDSTDEYNASLHLRMVSTDPSTQQVDDCARCHSRRVQFTKAYNHSGEFRDHYSPEILRDHVYFPDGQILDEDYVYSSFVQTKMYHQEVKCTNCHNPHSNKLLFEGNTLCLQCHVPADYDTYEHHFHKDDQGGQSCINCHMDGRFYMVNDYRRDHSFRVPRPDLSVEYEVPNACNSCHGDQTAQWAADWVKEWYGPERNKNYADVLCLGSTRSEEAVPALDTLVRSRNQPAIAKATAVWYLGFIDNERSNQAIISALNDPDPTVRYTAVEVMQSFPQDLRYQYITPLLKDPVRSVRVMAFDALTDIPETSFNADIRPVYQQVLPEYRSMLEVRADFPGGQLQRARYFERQGRVGEAEKALKKAVGFDSLFNAARINLAHLYHSEGNIREAINLFKLVTDIEPQYGPAYYSLGLLYAEQKEMDKAIEYLRKASEREPGNTRIFYNLGLAYQQTGKTAMAERTFLNALEIQPGDADIRYALTILYIQQEKFEKASEHINRLKQFFPDNPRISELEALINRNLNPD